METVASLGPGEGIRLLAPFRPAPLFAALELKGFTTRTGRSAAESGKCYLLRRNSGAKGERGMATRWPSPLMHLDNRGLMPPEPMVKVLGAVEAMQSGEVMDVLLDREPSFLFPQLEQRGHEWRGGFDPDGTAYRLLVRIGTKS